MAHEPQQTDSSDKDKRVLQREMELAKAKIATLETMLKHDIDIGRDKFSMSCRLLVIWCGAKSDASP